MALIDTVSALSNTLTITHGPELFRQWNRPAILAANFTVKPQNSPMASFPVEFSGALAGTVAEGSDVASSEYGSDNNLAATFGWAYYRAPFQVSDQVLDVAANTPQGVLDLEDLIGERVFGSVNKLATTISNDLTVGTGVDTNGNRTCIGVYNGALDSTSVYGNISRSAYSEWQGNTIAAPSGGLLTLDLLEQLEALIFSLSSEMPTRIICSVGIARKYRALFETIRHVTGEAPSKVDLGIGDNQNMYFKGIPVIRDPLNPAGKLVMLNDKYTRLKYFPYSVKRIPGDFQNLQGGNGVDERQQLSVPCRVSALGRTGENLKMMVVARVQACITRPNACGTITGISES